MVFIASGRFSTRWAMWSVTVSVKQFMATAAVGMVKL
jgi:hypothetical protein